MFAIDYSRVRVLQDKSDQKLLKKEKECKKLQKCNEDLIKRQDKIMRNSQNLSSDIGRSQKELQAVDNHLFNIENHLILAHQNQR